MTAFFVPEQRGEEAERAYAALSADALASTGHPTTARRIHKLSCRRSGRDCEFEVGQPDPFEGGVVLAIFDLGRHHSYTIHTRSPESECPNPPVALGRHIYSVTEFS